MGRPEAIGAVHRILFLDVDGVLNPFRATTGLHGDWRKCTFPDGGRYWTSPSLGRWLTDLHASGVRIVWATTWVDSPDDLERYAEIIGAPVGLDRIEFDEAEFASATSECGKRSGVDAWLAAHRPDRSGRAVVWVDDQIGPNDRRWAEAEGITVVTPHPASGLANSKLVDEIATALR